YAASTGYVSPTGFVAADEHPCLSLRGRRADRGNPSGLLRRCAPRNDKREVHRPEPSKTLVLVSSLRMTSRRESPPSGRPPQVVTTFPLRPFLRPNAQRPARRQREHIDQP